jgi:hypothetical protein
MTGTVTGSSATGLTTFLTTAGLGARLTTFRGGGALRTTFGGGFGVGVASSGVGRNSGGQDVQPTSPGKAMDRVIPMIACFQFLLTITSRLIKTRPDADWPLPRLVWPR